MAIIFDGRVYAKKLEEQVRKKSKLLKSHGVRPKLAAILFAKDDQGAKYLELKAKLAKRVGAEIDIFEINNWRGADYVIKLIAQMNRDEQVHGVMVQLPIPARLRQSHKKILNSILPKKDVDGLRDESPYMSATVKAVEHILKEAGVGKNNQILVIGSKGEIGRRVIKYLSFKGYAVDGIDKSTPSANKFSSPSFRNKSMKADVVISTTGNPSLVKADDIKSGAVVIDVGAPKGDVDFEAVSQKAGFITPVPGGVGPLTIVCLLENLVLAASQ